MTLPLAECALFDGLPAEALSDAHSLGVRRRLLAGATLFQEGAEATTLYVLLEGRVRVLRGSSGGTQLVLHYVQPGGVLGCALLGGARSYPGTAEVVEDGVALALETRGLDVLVGRFPRLARNGLRILSERVEDLRVRLQELSHERLDARLAHALLRLRAELGGADGDAPLRVSRQELAELVGASLFSVSRQLAEWERQGWLDTGRQRVTVRAPRGLARLAFGTEA